MDEPESELWSGWGLYVLLVPLFLISLALSQLVGYFDSLWLVQGRPRVLPADLQIVYALGQTMKWTPVAAVVYWLITAMPWGLARWLRRSDVIDGVAIGVFCQLLVFIMYFSGSVAASLWRK